MEYKQSVKPDKSIKKDIYLEQKILSASPEQLVAYVFDVAIAGCIKRDFDKTSSALNILIRSLDFDSDTKTKELSSKFYQTYSYLFELLRKKKFEKVQSYLKDIRLTWAKAMNVY
tara:strand:+ start:454 stop:798 length:345 start_codon:yes stop_codon:yes gene_type:complete